MTDKLQFYTNPRSRGAIVHWMLEEVGAPYETHVLEFGTTMKEPAYLAINPMGKVPAVVRGRTIVTECAAICAWLADAYPEADLAPSPGERADYYRWMFFAAGPLEAAVTNKALGVSVEAKQRGFVGYGAGLDQVLDALEGAVSANTWIAGERFSAADVYVGSQIGWGLRFGSFEPRPAFEAYWARLTQRPANARAMMAD
jgi:glutathione S-transferase